MTVLRPTAFMLCTVLLFACAKEAPPRTVTEFMDDQLLLEAVLLRCTENRAESRYDAECVNAREAVKLLEAKEAQAREAELEALSERKREALRRTQQAAAEARRRAAEFEKQREEREYQAQFGLPPPAANPQGDALQGNVPLAVIPPAAESTPAADGASALPAKPLPTAGSNVPVAEIPAPQPERAATETADLGAIRDELRRRNESAEPAESAEATAEATD